MRRLLTILAVFMLLSGALIVIPATAEATYPGAIGRIAFLSDRDQSSGELYVRDFSGGTWTRLTFDTHKEYDPAWSPVGPVVAYSSLAAGDGDIFILGVDGGGTINLTNDPYRNRGPAWSPDGLKIAYSSDHSGLSLGNHIWVVNVDGTGKTDLTPGLFAGSHIEPAWSPDGTKIAYSGGSSDRDIVVMNADGSDPTPLAAAPGDDRHPTWSPDGSKIAFTSNRTTGDPNVYDLYVMDADGSNVQRLTDLHTWIEEPAWSPDGAYIMFTLNAGGNRGLWMVDADGSNLRIHTDDSGWDNSPTWESVNRPPTAVNDAYVVEPGTTLVASSVLANDTDPDGDPLVAQLSSGPSHAASFSFAPDGTFTYVHDGSSTTTDSFRYLVRDSRGSLSNKALVVITVGWADDVGLVDPETGIWYLRNHAGQVTSFYYGNPGDVPFMGDWDGDGIDTPGLYRQSDGYVYLRNSNTQGPADITFFFGNPDDVPLAGDFDGCVCDSVSIYRPSEQRFYIVNTLGQNGGGLGPADFDFLFGNPGDKPVVGDWDGDGADEVGLHRESTGFFYYRNTLDTGVADGQFYFGDPGDRFVAGDWGVLDGRDTPAVYRGSDRTFYFRHTLTEGVADSQFVWSGAGADWLPVAGVFGLN